MKLKFLPLVIACLSLSGCGDWKWFPETTTSTSTTVPTVPTLSATISPTSIASGGTSTITYTILSKTNLPTGLGFAETLPSGVTASVSNNSQCGGNLAATSGKIVFTGTTALTTTSCTMTATLTGTNSGTTSLDIPIASADFIASQFQGGLVNGVTTQTLTVAPAPLTAPILTTAISPISMLDGGDSTLTFTITNSAGNPAQSNLQFLQQLPVGLTATATSNCGGTVNVTTQASANLPGFISFQNGLLPINTASCTITAKLTLFPSLVGTIAADKPLTFKSTDFTQFLGGLTNGVTADKTLTIFPLGQTSGVASVGSLVVTDPSNTGSGPFTFSVDTHNTSSAPVNVTVRVIAIDLTGAPIAATQTDFSGQLPAIQDTQIQLSSTTPKIVSASDIANIKFWRIVSVTVN